MPDIRAIVAVDGDNLLYPRHPWWPSDRDPINRQRLSQFILATVAQPATVIHAIWMETARAQHIGTNWQFRLSEDGWYVLTNDEVHGGRFAPGRDDNLLISAVQKVLADMNSGHLFLATRDGDFSLLFEDAKARHIGRTLICPRHNVSRKLRKLAQQTVYLEDHCDQLLTDGGRRFDLRGRSR